MKLRNRKQEECKHEFNMGGELAGLNRPPLIHFACTKGCGYGSLCFEQPYFNSYDKIDIKEVENIISAINNFHNISKLWYAKSSDIEEYDEELELNK